MPNHVHFVANLPLHFSTPFHALMHHFKGRTAYTANRLLNRRGAFWQSESYDHVVRDSAELSRIVTYVLQNPVKARLVSDWQDWPFSYLSPDFIGQ